ncbi:STAS domain-containing protein [Amycolatopsis rhizosphaerae]|uniref:Anti-sigma factor antagonist n=1 Tax=Amycolatopsis rhizosphaerae TaxID=2053003 RepID=A0A558CRX5_9PSEU|nr:STAS domain-containing protein [Amycolatopsis rhizosphaerae]TVT51520.1 STAS domain-containing protein [Amycolatopsis rhizosphaerae]
MSQPLVPTGQAQPGSLGLAIDRPEPEVIVLTVSGELDMLTAPRLAASLEELLAAAPRTLVVDLGGVTFLGSAGLAVLVTAHELAPGREVLRIAAGNRQIRRAFTMTGLDNLLALYESREAALSEA